MRIGRYGTTCRTCATQHGDGAVVVPVEIPVVLENMSSNTGLIASGVGHQPTASKRGVRFEPYPDKPASEFCTAYLQLCRRFVDDFLRDHGALI